MQIKKNTNITTVTESCLFLLAYFCYRRSPLQWQRGSLETTCERGLFSTLKIGQMKTTLKNNSR